MLSLLLDLERWDADLILCEEAWKKTDDGLPVFTEELWEKFVVLQTKRRALIERGRIAGLIGIKG